MKFDIAILNPPYDRNLHLKILEKVIPHCEETINISPIRWLQDPLAKYKKNSDYNKFKESIAEHINKVKVVENTNELFGTAMYDTAISHLDNNRNNFNFDKFLQKTFGKSINIINKVVENLQDNIDNHTQLGVNGVSVKIATIRGFGGGKNFDIISNIHSKPYLDKEDYEKTKFKKGDCTNTDSSKETFVKLDSEEEAINFINSTKTTFFKFLVVILKRDVHVPLKFLPFMSDYTHPWDNKRFCDYFNITGYISDSEAEPGSEWEEILKTMSKYK